MSILYLNIKAVDIAGNIIDYSVDEAFKDFNELLNWFAYDIDPNTQIIRGKLVNFDYSTPTRFENLVINQNLCGLDANYIIDNTIYIRNKVLYDINNHKFIDIRNYLKEIKSHVHSAILHTEYYLKNKRKYKQNRTHYKGYTNGGMSSFYKTKLIANEPLVDLEDFNYKVNISMHYYSPSDFWVSRAREENNWKSKKVRKQWQYHKNISCKKHYRNKIKYCDNSWIYNKNDEVA